MRRLMVIVWLVLTLVVVAMGYVRLAPSDPVEWHQMPDQPLVKDFANGVIRVVETGPNGLAELDAIAIATPHTERRFGSVEDGMVTYVTRSVVFGFPDYTTARQTGNTLEIYGRARFGRSDLGVNRTRVEGWIDALQLR